MLLPIYGSFQVKCPGLTREHHHVESIKEKVLVWSSTPTHTYTMVYANPDLLRAYYRKDAADGRLTEHEVKKAVEHSGGGYISDHHAGQLLRSLAGWDGVVTEQEFVTGVERYVQQHGHSW